MLVRSTWASHLRSRNGAGVGDGGLGTSRTIVRFVLGKPRGHYERRIQLEAESESSPSRDTFRKLMSFGQRITT